MPSLRDAGAGRLLEIEFLNQAPTRLARQELIELPYWMDVRFTLNSPERTWSASMEALTAQEVDGLIADLRAWSLHPEAEAEADFMEPNLSFAKKSSPGPRIRIDLGFDLEFHPDRAQEAGDPYWVPFEVEEEELRDFADSLRAELVRIAPAMAD